jgi:DNA-directed RNA polymerase I, II, and III subunit RPABC5
MIIPVRCFTCGKVVGDKYRWYLEQVADIKEKQKSKGHPISEYFHLDFSGETAEAIVLNRLKLTRQCCRRHMLTHVDIE